MISKKNARQKIADDTKIDGTIDNDKVSSVKSLRAGDKMGFAWTMCCNRDKCKVKQWGIGNVNHSGRKAVNQKYYNQLQNKATGKWMMVWGKG